MQNYHRHTSYSNIFTPDSAAMNEHYAKRAVELGHKIICSMEHGWQGNYFECYELAKKYNLKFVFGVEGYWVKDRQKEYFNGLNKKGEETYAKDRSNHHIVLLAKNENGRQAINEALSEANETGYYFRPRLDLELLLNLPPEDVFVTTACIAFAGYEDIDDIILQLHDHFKSNFMLEIQNHDTDKQREWNKHLKEIGEKYGIELIVGLDSHYIYEDDDWKRDAILQAKGVIYEDELFWFMDYPSDEVVMERFLKQGIFTREEVQRAMDNTDITLTFDDYDNVPIFSKDIKLPTLYPDLTIEEKNKLYRRLIGKKFVEYMKNIPKENYDKYYKGVESEIKTYEDTGMVDYPLLDYEIVKDAVEHGGLITDTGRGSSVGFLTNTLCGFSKVDRFTSAIKLYPERFISTTRILETRSLPDIDLNVGTVEIFEDAQKRVLGEDHVYPMIAFGTLKKKSAFKLYAKAEGIDFGIANAISEQIGYYDEAMKKADEEEKEDIDLYDYVDRAYEEFIEKSREYWGIISDKKKAPSAYLLYQGDIRREIGLIKCKSESTKKEYITCVIDGAVAENYKFLKNDVLKVDVVLLIDKVFKRIGIEHFDVNTLLKLSEKDDKVWSLYADGFTMGMNQVEQDGSRKKCMRYKPHNISELSAFVAAIRPGFKSMYSKFEKREEFSYGLPTLDNLIQTEQFPYSYMIYQENIMSVLHYAGFPMDQCYGIIKAIAKKHPEKVLPLKSQFIEGFKQAIIKDEKIDEDKASDYSDQVWQIINDNVSYSFNCVSGDTKIIRSARNDKFEPTVAEMYKIMNDADYARNTGHRSLHDKFKRNGYGKALSMFEDFRLRPNQVVGIYEAGIRKTYEVITESGCSLICTENHKFPTPNGKKRLDELKVGDLLYCKGEYKHKYFDTSLTDGNFESNMPKKGEQGFQTKEDGAYAIYKRTMLEHRNNMDSCDLCGKKYSDADRFEIHHKDMDRHNNKKENFQWLCCSCHKKIHYKNGRNKRYGNGIETYLSPIVSIKPHKIEMTYDIEMADPAHNFVSESGLVTSNSAHAYSVALDSLYQAWQKANYPYEFYETLLQHYSDKGKKEKVAALKKEMKKAFNILEGDYKFRNDNRAFASDKEKGVIYPSLASVKNVSQKTANSLYKLGKNTYNSYIDLLVDIKKEKINIRQLDILIKLDYFSEFGEINNILAQTALFEKFYTRSQIKKAEIETLDLSEELIRSHAGKETEKLYSDIDMIALIKELAKSVSSRRTTTAQKAYYQWRYLGYVDLIDPDYKGYCIVNSVNANYTPRLNVYPLANGNALSVKISKPIFRKNPVEEGDVLKVGNQRKKNRVRLTPDGKFVPIDDEFEWWITEYEIVGVTKDK